MQIPKYHETFIPILKVLADGKPVHYNELRKRVRDEQYSHLPPELLDKRTSSGDILILNRVGWGKAYLKMAKLVQQPERAMVQITEKGQQVLKGGKFTLSDLHNDPDYKAHKASVKERKKEKEKETEIDLEDSNASPEDMIDSGFRAIEEQVKSDLLDKLKEIDPYQFEKIILELLEEMGYGEFVETPKSNDGGIDGIINQDKLGIDKIYIQAKRYNENKVREPDIRNFIGAIGRDAKGVFVTTTSFDIKAIEKARDAAQKIILIDGEKLVDLMHKFEIGVQVRNTYKVKQVDEDFFEEG